MNKTRRGFLKLVAAAVPVGALIATAKPAHAVSLVSAGDESIRFDSRPEVITVSGKLWIENQFFSFTASPHNWCMTVVNGRIIHLDATFTAEEAQKHELPMYRTELARANRLIHLKQPGGKLVMSQIDVFARTWRVVFAWPPK